MKTEHAAKQNNTDDKEAPTPDFRLTYFIQHKGNR